jgi:hypothetical protein
VSRAINVRLPASPGPLGRRVAPQALELIVVADVRLKDVHHDVDHVDQNPAQRVVALHVVDIDAVTVRLLEHVVRDRLDLGT